MNADVIVMGAGYAGLMCAWQMARAGRRVLLLAKGNGSTHIRGGMIDVLGYANGARVEHPFATLADYRAAHPQHPYAQLDDAILRKSLDDFRALMHDAGNDYIGDGATNYLLPTAVGAARPTALAARTMAQGDLRSDAPMLLVGFNNFKDFYPALVAQNLAKTAPHISVRHVTIDLPTFEQDADTLPINIARAFDRADFRARVGEAIRPHLQRGERVGVPALLGLANGAAAHADLEAQLDSPVFEVASLPPSIAGIRVFTAFTEALRRLGARVQIGHAIVGAQTESGCVVSVSTKSAARLIEWRADQFVLATGGVYGEGITVDAHGAVREAIFGLPISGVPTGARFSPRYFDAHAFNALGVAVNAHMEPTDASGQAIYDNLFACGATLACGEAWRDKTQDAISLASATRAAKSMLT
jgi:glycerol-3-phosphate dehydrogenase subunit B